MGFNKTRSISWNVDVAIEYLSTGFAHNTLTVDRHFRLQFHNLGSGLIELEHVLPIERSSLVISSLSKIFSMPEKDIAVIWTKSNSSGRKNMRLDRMQTAKIVRLYAQDYDYLRQWDTQCLML
jgi:hypothetical protein